MALRNQPYIPLYVQDVLTDEKLIECSAASHGVYFRLICILHKQDKYGLLCLKQKYKQTLSKTENFAQMLCKQMPFDAKTIANALEELESEKVIVIGTDDLYQKRMLRDGEISITRTETGKLGGSSVTKQYGVKGFLYLMSDGYELNKIGISVNPKNRLYRLRCDLKLPKNFVVKQQIEVNDMGNSEDFAKLFFKEIIDGEWLKGSYNDISSKFLLLQAKLKANAQANVEAIPEYENESEYEDKNDKEKGLKGKNKKSFTPPTLEEFTTYFLENGYDQILAERAWKGYDAADWKDSLGNNIKSWKQKCQHVWFKESNRVNNNQNTSADSKFDKLKQAHSGVVNPYQ